VDAFWARNVWFTRLLTITVSIAFGWAVHGLKPFDSVPGGFHIVGKAQIVQTVGTASGGNAVGPCSLGGWCDFEIHVNLTDVGQAQATLSCEGRPSCVRFLSDNAKTSYTDYQDSGEGDNGQSVGASATIILRPTTK
jgi:hypothetical protein